MIPDDFIEGIIARGWEVAERALGARWKKQGPNALFRVPWREDNSPSLAVLRVPHNGYGPGFWRDFATGESGDCIDLLRRMYNLEFAQAVERGASLLGLQMPLNGNGHHAMHAPKQREEQPQPPHQPAGSAPHMPRPSGLADLATEYGLDSEDYSAAGCTLETRRNPRSQDPETLCVRYPILRSDGRIVGKYKSLHRNDRGKRDSWGDKGSDFQHGLFCCGVENASGATLVIAEGEEKAIAASFLGFPAVSPANGASAFSEECVAIVRDLNPARIVIAYDADDAGREGTQTVAAALKAAGFEESAIRTVIWAQDASKGYDLTDHLQEYGEDARDLIAAAIPVREAFRPPLPPGWRPVSMAQCLEVRPLLIYPVEDIIEEGTITVLVGNSGTQKTMLLLDMAVCVAAGRPWMETACQSAPGRTFRTRHSPVLFYGADTSTRTIMDRTGALLRGHSLGADLPFFPYLFPDPALDLTNEDSAKLLHASIINSGSKLAVVDCLMVASGAAEENDATQMRPAMNNLRRITDSTGCAIILIHHTDKDGERYRGSSAIHNLTDVMLQVERPDRKQDYVTVSQRKERNAEIPDFGCYFAYEHKAGTRQLQTGKMLSYSAPTEESLARAWLVHTVGESEGITVRSLRDEWKVSRDGGGAPFSRDLMEAVLGRLVQDRTIERYPLPIQGRGRPQDGHRLIDLGGYK